MATLPSIITVASNPAALAADWPGNFWLHLLIFTVVIIGFVLTTVVIFIWFERRLVGRFQIRCGPNRAGPFGLLQPVADVLKLLTKEGNIPKNGDKLLFWLAPIVAFTPVLLVFAVIPFWEGAALVDLDIGVIYIIAISSLSSIGIFMAGWASNNKYSLIGAMRDVGQLVSYEIPLVLATAGVVLFSGSLSVSGVVAAQDIPFILLQPLAFAIYFMAGLAEINRCPFDMVEADSELISGYNIEYSGMKFAMLMLTEYSEAILLSVLVTTFFLGGWRGPLLPPLVWFLIKVVGVFFLIDWVRFTLMRLRIDQVMAFAWKFLLPLALINLIITGVEVVLLPDISPWLLVVINLAVMVFLILTWAKMFKPGGEKVEA